VAWVIVFFNFILSVGGVVSAIFLMK